MGQMLNLDQIGAIEGTDKSSIVSYAWDYLRHYEEWFAPWRDQDINLVEIGVFNGSSIAVWLKYFSRAQIIGVDINPKCARFAGDRVSIKIGSQDDPQFLQQVCAESKPTIIIDDGSHLAHHIIYTFEQMFPSLLPGGLYVVEDMAFHFGDQAKNWAAGVDGFFPGEYFLEIAKNCMNSRAKSHLNWGTKGYIEENVDSVHFVSSAVYVRKKSPVVQSFDPESAKQYSQSEGVYPDGLLRYILSMVNKGVSLTSAETEVLKIEDIDKTVDYYKTLAELKKNGGNIGAAIKTLLEGVSVYPESWDLVSRCGEYQDQNGDYESAIYSLEKALTLCTDRNFSQTIDRFLTELRNLHKSSDKVKSVS
jgi:hypothetical protein